MRKQTWMDGLLEAELLHKQHGYTLNDLRVYLRGESSLVSGDYRWDMWMEGFGDYIKNLEIRLSIH